MTTKGTIRVFVLETLDRVGDQPMPEGALISAVILTHRHLDVSRTDARAEMLAMESDGLVSATRDDVTDQTLYVLTPKGRSAFRARR